MPNNDVVIAGEFSAVGNVAAGDVSANRIARWNGSSWSALSSGLSDSVFALAVLPSGDLVAGGSFTDAVGSTPAANRIAQWNGTAWSTLDAGIGSVGSINNINHPLGSVFALAVAGDGTLIVGGDFGTAGGQPSAYIARYGCAACPADFNGDSIRDVADLFGYINAWLAKTANADFNHDNVVDVADLFGFINAWLAGC